MYSKKIKIILILPVILFLGLTTLNSDIFFKMSKAIDIFGRVYKELTLNYVDPINPGQLMLRGIRGMLSGLDPYTVYLDANQQKSINLITSGKYGGIGVTVGFRNGKVTILDLFEGYSAQRQGLRIGDVILKVDSIKINKDNYEKLGTLLKRKPGSLISLTVKREGVKGDLIFNLVSEEIKVKNLSYYGFVPNNSNNAYLKLSGFSRLAGVEVKNALLKLKHQKKINSVMLDLRGNPGGLLEAAVNVAEKFLKKNDLIVSVIGRDTSNIKKYFSDEQPIVGKVKLVVLINGGSASASEIVTGAIQDHDRGIILGTKSFGKGLVQTIVPLSYNTSLKLTTAKYYTPSGRNIQRIDYAKKNKVFAVHPNDEPKKFKTDDGRTVYSKGGILPDTVVVSNFNASIVKNLLAKGMFFRFATLYFNENSNIKLDKLSSELLFQKFKDYLNSIHYKYETEAEKLLKDLNKTASLNKYPIKIVKQINLLDSYIHTINNNELSKYKNEIADKIKEELAARLWGRKGRVRETLKFDKQFKVALNVLNNNKIYDRLLNIKHN